jgi:hypothetical protein
MPTLQATSEEAVKSVGIRSRYANHDLIKINKDAKFGPILASELIPLLYALDFWVTAANKSTAYAT